MIAIPVAFCLLAALLLWLVVWARGPWWAKLPLLVGVPAFSFVIWRSLDSYRGWPADRPAPARALLVSSEVREPDRQTRGVIYLWLLPARAPRVSAPELTLVVPGWRAPSPRPAAPPRATRACR